MATTHQSKFAFVDYSNETSGFTIYNGAITALTIADFLTKFGALKAATNDLTLGILKKEVWVGDETTFTTFPPVDPDAQRERKALVVYEGNSTKKLFTITIPTIRTKNAAGESLLMTGTDRFDLSDELVEAWVDAFEAIARTPDSDTETVTVKEIRLVGRNI